jgi:hypothetical protein
VGWGVRAVLFLVVAGFLCTTEAGAELLQYQARLTDPATGTPLHGLLSMTFRLYDTPEDGAVLWAESKDVEVTGGLLSTLLGDSVAFPGDLFDGRELWLGIQAGGDDEAFPRQRIVPVAYAAFAANAGKALTLDGLGPSDFAPAYHTHQGTDIATGYLEDAVIPEFIARIFDIMPYVLNEDGTDSLLDADFLDGLDSTDFVQVSTILANLLAQDGAGSGLDADRLDGIDSSGFWKLGGNAVDSRMYLGTSTAHPLVLVANGGEILQLEYNPDLGPPTIIGGFSYVAPGVYGATISGGGGGGLDENRVFDNGGTIGGGTRNRAGSEDSIPSTAAYATVGGGLGNRATASRATVGGGDNNLASAQSATVAGGKQNEATGTHAAVGGGEGNLAIGAHSVIGGGELNSADTAHATVGGGFNNAAQGSHGTVGGGEANVAQGAHSTVGGGQSNLANNAHGTVAGGTYNEVQADAASIGGGTGNIVSGYAAVIAGGEGNNATAGHSTVGGGQNNLAADFYATVPGGLSNSALGFASFAAGHFAKAVHSGAFVWGDYSLSDVFSDRANQVKFRASGGMRVIASASGLNPAALQVESTSANGVGLYVSQSSTDTNLVVTNTGSGNLIRGFSGATGGDLVFRVENSGATHALSFNPTSDRNAKENFAPVDGREVLEKLAELPIATWNYRKEDAAVRHMGPVAQDFHTAFGLGSTDTSIATIDTDGVALAAIQGLHGRSREQSERIEQLESENAVLREELRTLAARLTALERQDGR